MPITPRDIEDTLKELGLAVESDGKHYVYSSKGRHAPRLDAIITVDEDASGATLIVALPGRIATEKHTAICELLNAVHGQSLWNVRFHLDDTGRVFSAGKVMLWGRPFNGVQFGDVFFSLLVSTDRLYPCVVAVNEEGMPASAAFERFFLKAVEAEGSD